MRLHWHKIVIIAALGLSSILLVQWNKLSTAADMSHSAESMAAHRASPAAPVQTAEKAAAANEVIIDNFAFAPASLTVSVGTTAQWTNRYGESPRVNRPH